MSPPELQRAREKNNPILELKIISASDVGHINVEDKMDVYAIVSLTGDNIRKKQSVKTPIDFHGGSNPTWNHSVNFSVNEEAARLNLKVKLFSYWLKGENDLYLGEVNVSVKELLGSNPLPPLTNGNDSKLRSVIYPLKITDVTRGTLSFSYRFNPAVLPVNDFYPLAPDDSLSHGQPINPNPDPASLGQPVMYSPKFQTTTTKLTLELIIKSAKDISKVSFGNEMSVYASIIIREGTATIKEKTNTPVVYCAYRNPRWDHEAKFCLDEKLVREGRLTLVMKLTGVRMILEDKDIGEVNVPIKELFDFNPPSLPSTNGAGGGHDNGMILVTRGVSVEGLYGEKKGTLSFMYRFLAEQAPQPFIMYPIHGNSGYSIVQPGANAGSSNGQRPIYMQPQYHQSHLYQHYSPPQPQKSQSQLQQPLLHTQSQSQSKPQPYKQYSPPQLQPLSQQLPPTQSEPQTEGERPTLANPQGGSIAALGIGAAIVGRVIGGALMGDIL